MTSSKMRMIGPLTTSLFNIKEQSWDENDAREMYGDSEHGKSWDEREKIWDEKPDVIDC